MAMNKQRRTSNINNIVSYDASGNVTLPAQLSIPGQLKLTGYLNTSSFTGTVVGYLAFDASGNILSASVPTVLNGTGIVRTVGTNISYISGTSAQFLKGDGSLDSNTYALSSHTHDDRYFTETETNDLIVPGLRAGMNITGGGTISVDGSGNVTWSQRFIVISNGRSATSSVAGYFDITVPTAGTVITGAGGAANKTVVAAGIPLTAWEALYYILPFGSSNASVAANFRVVNYTVDLTVPYNWLLLCVRNGDGSLFRFTNGFTLGLGDSTAGYETSSNIANTLVSRDGSGNFSAGTITAALNGNASTATSATSATNATNASFSTTQATDNNSTAIATTAYVKSLLGSTTTSGTLDWNHVSNTQPGTSPTLLLASATNGFAGGSIYYHPFNLEYASKNGTGNITQLAIAYGSPGNDIKMRGRYDNVWSSWVTFLNSGNYTDYAPTKAGVGATGTWSINISGTAASETLATVTARGNIASGSIQANNFYDAIGSYNVNLGCAGNEGRGVVAGYSGSSYSGIGYNVRHTTTGGVWVAPGTDTSSYLVFGNAGFTFYGAPSGTAGRTLNYITLGSLDALGTFNAVNVTVSGNQTLHHANWNSYAPSLTGTGASGTWSINVTGDAGTVGGISTARMVLGESGRRRGVSLVTDWNQATFPDAAFLSSESNTTNAPTTDYIYGVQTSFHRNGPTYRTQFVTALYGNNSYWLRQLGDGANWTSWVNIIHSGNYNSYSPTLTGTGASGTWSININGNAATVTGGVYTSGNQSISGAKVFSVPDNTYIHTVATADQGLTVFQANTQADAYMTFHVAGNYAAFFGIGGAEDDLVYGGWSAGAVRHRILHSGNYTAWAPSLTGTGATGTWGISITGSAASATTAGAISIDNTVTYGRSGLQFAQSPGPAGNDPTAHQAPTGDWWHILRMNHGNSAGYYSDLAVSMTTNLGLARRVISNGSQLSGWVTILDSLNYNSYSPTLTGGNASGTWGINVTGNAATVTVSAGNNTGTWFPIVWHSGNYLYSSSGLAEILPSAGYARFSYINTTDNDADAVTRFVIKNGDNYHRSATTTVAADAIRAVASGFWNIVSSQVSINYGNDSNSNYYLLWGSGNSVFATGNVYVNPSTDTLYTYAYRGNGNVGGTGEASWHPAGIYSGGTNWLYGTVYLNGNDISGAGQVYANGWFRSNNTHTGLYNQVTTQHWSSKDNGYWDASSTNTVSSIRFFTGGHLTDLRGYVFANSSNELGFQDSAGTWIIRTVGTANTYITGALTVSSTVTATAFFESSDIRLKTVLETNPDKTVDIDVIKFERKDAAGVRYGYSAQDVQKIAPELVAGSDFLSVNYLDLHTLKIAALERELRELKAKLGN